MKHKREFNKILIFYPCHLFLDHSNYDPGIDAPKLVQPIFPEYDIYHIGI